jgi:hypothetical protein
MEQNYVGVNSELATKCAENNLYTAFNSHSLEHFAAVCLFVCYLAVEFD